MNAHDAERESRNRAREASDEALQRWCDKEYRPSTKVSRTALCLVGGCVVLGAAAMCYIIGSMIAIIGRYFLR